MNLAEVKHLRIVDVNWVYQFRKHCHCYHRVQSWSILAFFGNDWDDCCIEQTNISEAFTQCSNEGKTHFYRSLNLLSSVISLSWKSFNKTEKKLRFHFFGSYNFWLTWTGWSLLVSMITYLALVILFDTQERKKIIKRTESSWNECSIWYHSYASHSS